MLLWVLILALFGAAVAVFGSNLPRPCAPACWRAGADRRGLPGVPAVHLQPVRAPLSRAARRQRPQPAAAGPRPRLPSAVALSGLCRLLGGLRLRRRRPDRRPRRCRLGALGAAVDARGLVLPDLGIALASWWAYYMLGWGGFWFWDPVENASLMPWLAGTALIHSAIVVEKRDTLKSWTVLLAILAFSLSLLGTFLVRSGVLTSVHAFAQDPGARHVHPGLPAAGRRRRPRRSTPGGRRSSPSGGLFEPVSREGALMLNNLLLCTLGRDGVAGHALPAVPGPRWRAPRFRSARRTSTPPSCRSAPRCSPRSASARSWPGSAPRSRPRWPACASAFAVAVDRRDRHRRRDRRPRDALRARLRLRRLADRGQPHRIRAAR